MCTVQVLLVADVMRRTTFNNNNNISPSARSICRRLFAEESTPSEKSPSVVLRALETDIQREVKERWNFDFQTETPLPGRYQWVPVHPKVDNRLPSTNTVEAEVPQKDNKNKQTNTNKQASRNKLRTQSKITDFLQQRKRNSTDESSLISPKLKKLRRLASSSSSSSTNAIFFSSSSTRD